MTADPRDLPVVLVLYRRPDHLRRLIDRLRPTAPRTVFAVADGPRPEVAGDAEAVAATRAVLDEIDWPCRLERVEAATNLGCDVRVPTGLDVVFDQVDRALVLEDDMVPDPSLPAWIAALLDRHDGDPVVRIVCGRNELGRWGPPGADALVATRASIWGWATWAATWRRGRMLAAAGGPDVDPMAVVVEPLLAEHLARRRAALRDGSLAAWDTIWTTVLALDGGLAAVPPVNLVGNAGFGPGANRTTYDDDVRAALPLLGPAPVPAPGPGGPARVDTTYDRWSLLVELLAAVRRPRVTARLARTRRLLADPRVVQGEELDQHLLPFRHPTESLAVIDHLRSVGLSSPLLDELTVELTALAAGDPS